MKKIDFSVIFIAVSVIWLGIFAYLFSQFITINDEIIYIKESAKKVENITFYERNVSSLEEEYESVSVQSFTTKSASEFIAKLPKLGELSGITEMEIENTGISIEESLEINSLEIITRSQFPDVANYIDILERSKLPIQIATLKMAINGDIVDSSMSVRVYKKIIED